jgi:hypothetical protein
MLSCLTQAIEVGQEVQVAHYLLGTSYCGSEDYEICARELELAAPHFPHDETINVNLG